MEPRIQYARTNDGASLAYWVIGDGPTLIQLPSVPFTHIQKEWEDPDWRAWYERMAAKFRLVRYDARGCGLSSSSDPTYSLETMLEDLRAVVEKTAS